MAKVVFVGGDRKYSSIQLAIDNAKTDDIIVIDPAIYEENVIINKLVHLRGNTDNPEKGEVIIHGNSDIPIVFNYLPTQKETVYIEGLELVRSEASCQKLCLVSDSNSDLSIVFNRCRILAGGAQYPMAISSGVCTDNVIIKYCYLQRGIAHLSRFTEACNNYSAIIRTELDGSFKSALSKGRPNKIDIVKVPKSGYGPAYGSYYKQIPDSLWQKIRNKIGV